MTKLMKPNTKERLIAAGLELLNEKSYNGVGLTAILKSAGVPRGSFYHYFQSKEDFAIEIIEHTNEIHLEDMREILSNRKRNGRQRILDYFESGLKHHQREGPLKRCLVAKLALELSQLSEPLRAAIKCAYDNWTSRLAQALAEAKADGSVPADIDPAKTAYLLTDLWEGASIRIQIDRDLRPLELVIQHIEQILTPR